MEKPARFGGLLYSRFNPKIPKNQSWFTSIKTSYTHFPKEIHPEISDWYPKQPSYRNGSKTIKAFDFPTDRDPIFGAESLPGSYANPKTWANSWHFFLARKRVEFWWVLQKYPLGNRYISHRKGKGKSSTQNAIFGWYVSFLEGILPPINHVFFREKWDVSNSTWPFKHSHCQLNHYYGGQMCASAARPKRGKKCVP